MFRIYSFHFLLYLTSIRDFTMSFQSTTISTPFIYLQPRNRNDIAPKKVLMGSTVKSLIKNATKLFKSFGKVKAIYTETGELVTDISQVLPTLVYYVSSEDPNINQNHQNITKNSPKQSQTPSPTKQSDAFSKLFGNGLVSTPIRENNHFEEEEEKVQKQIKIFKREKRTFGKSKIRKSLKEKEKEKFHEDEENPS